MRVAVSTPQLGSSVAAIVFFVLIAAYWMTTPEAESIWIPILFAAVFAIIGFHEWRRRRARTGEAHEAMREDQVGRPR